MVLIRVVLGMSRKYQCLTQKKFKDKNSHNAVAEDNLKRVQLVLTDAEKHLKKFEQCLKFNEKDNDKDNWSDDKGEGGVIVEDNF